MISLRKMCQLILTISQKRNSPGVLKLKKAASCFEKVSNDGNVLVTEFPSKPFDIVLPVFWEEFAAQECSEAVET